LVRATPLLTETVGRRRLAMDRPEVVVNQIDVSARDLD
jgi:hypothetical protein